MTEVDAWVPKTEAERMMDRRYRGWSSGRRLAKAMEVVLADGISQAEAARRYGVSRPRLNQKLKKHREELDRRMQMSDAAAQRRRQHRPLSSADPASPEVQARLQSADETIVPSESDIDRPLWISNEIRRVPPIKEFVRRYFDGFKCFDCGVHHEVPKFHDEMMDFAQDPTIKRGLILVPPGHSKSTCITVWCSIHELYSDPNVMISIVSAGGDLAQAFVYQIANLLTDDRLYEDCTANPIAELGALREPGSGWSQKGFYVGRISPEKDPSIRAFGIGSDIYGRRSHRIICDDIADVNNQTNPDQVEKMRRKVVREFDTRVGDNGKLLIVGTRVHTDDIYSHLLQLEGYEVYRRPCIINEQEGLTLWPDHFGIDAAIRARKRMTPTEFELVYQNVDLPTTEAVFTQEQIDRCHDTDRGLGSVPPGCYTFIGVDPAGAGEQAGYTAMVCYAVDMKTGQRYLVDLVNQKQMRAYQLKDQIFDWVERYRPRELVVEANGLQSQLVQYNQELLVPLAEKGVRVSGHLTHSGRGRGGKQDPVFGVQAMAPLLHNGAINIPWGPIDTRKRVSELEHQLVRFPYGMVTDLVMALWIAETAVKNFWQTQLIEPFDPRTTASWPSRITKKRTIWDPSTGELRGATRDEQRGIPLGEMEERRLVNVNRTVMYPRGA